MNPAYEPLFTPFSIRNTRIKNRYFMAAMGTVTHNDEDGAYLPDAVDYFVRRAAGGVGLTACTPLTPRSSCSSRPALAAAPCPP